MFDDVCRWLKPIVLGLFAGHDSMIYFAVHHFKVMDFFANSFSKLKQLQPGMIEWKSAPVGWRSSLYQTAIKQPKKLVNLMVLTSDYKSCQMDKWIQSMKTWWIMVKSQIQIMARRWVFKAQGADTWLRQANGERLWQLWEASDEAVSPAANLLSSASNQRWIVWTILPSDISFVDALRHPAAIPTQCAQMCG